MHGTELAHDHIACATPLSHAPHTYLNPLSGNPEIESWATGAVTTMSGMLSDAKAFNRDLR